MISIFLNRRIILDIFVRPGDSLWLYSQLFKIHLQLIMDSNPNINPLSLQINEQIKIPGFRTVNYKTISGDTLWGIAEKKRIPVETILLTNAHLSPTHLQIGQTIKIPQRVTLRIIFGKQDYDHDIMMIDIKHLQRIYPFLKVSSIGNSVLGHDLPEIKIGSGDKKVHYNASFHANEWITTPIVMTFLNDYLLSLTNACVIRDISPSQLYEQTTLSIVPMVNPDGVNLVLNGPGSSGPWKEQVISWNNNRLDFSGWKANIRGVDLNDQFPAEWEKERKHNPKSPGPRDYGGKQPFTEPEVIAMAELTRKQNFDRVFALHTQGEEIYWGFEGLEPSKSKIMVEELSRVSGYKPVQILDSFAGYKDWFIQEWRRPGFTVELGKGENPLPLSKFDKIYQDVLGIFLAGLYL